jgi:hypothetical protein
MCDKKRFPLFCRGQTRFRSLLRELQHQKKISQLRQSFPVHTVDVKFLEDCRAVCFTSNDFKCMQKNTHKENTHKKWKM